MAKYLDYAGLTYFTNKIKAHFATKDVATKTVDGLMSSADKTKLEGIATGAEKNPDAATTSKDGLMSKADKTKLNGVATGAEVNVITGIKRNSLTVTPDGKVVDITVPTAVSDLTNDSEYQTLAEVQAAIVAAGHMKKQIVDTLPTSGQENIIYLVPNAGPEGDIYDEYLWIGSKWEKIGDTATVVDLTPYLRKTDMVAITNSEIDTMLA